MGKFFLSTLFLLAVLALGLGGGYLLVSQLPVNQASQSPSPQKESPTPTSSPDQTASWKTYVNNKYHYSFKYPPDYKVGPCTKKPCSPFLLEEKGEDRVLIEGDISNKGWPYIDITHLDTPFYNPPPETDLITWLKQKSPNKELVPAKNNFILDSIPAVKVHVPGSSQAYSMDEIYFFKDQKLLKITMLDVDSIPAKEFYGAFLLTLRFSE